MIQAPVDNLERSGCVRQGSAHGWPVCGLRADLSPTVTNGGVAMTPDQIREARRTLGERWGRGGPLTLRQMATLLRLAPASGDETVLAWESGKTRVSGPVSVAVEMMLAGAEPPTKAEALSARGSR